MQLPTKETYITAKCEGVSPPLVVLTVASLTIVLVRTNQQTGAPCRSPPPVVFHLLPGALQLQGQQGGLKSCQKVYNMV